MMLRIVIYKERGRGALLIQLLTPKNISRQGRRILKLPIKKCLHTLSSSSPFLLHLIEENGKF